MRRVGRYSRARVKICVVILLGALFMIIKYVLKTSPTLKRVLSGGEHPYTEKHGEVLFKDVSAVIPEEVVLEEVMLEPVTEEVIRVTTADPITDEQPLMQQEQALDSPLVPREDVETTTEVPDTLEKMDTQISEPQVETPPSEVATEAYCVKCRVKRGMQNEKRIVTKNGRSAIEGTCPVCGTRLFRFVSSK
ncbi:hypothetical protein KDA_12480 [Dictyobacter alpinus]|uniref:DUF5679 domain-containing protein n=1 Tax=Dictyobacter alpinus TaxID=2014873 RepID=A0A402B335_9CHLR|nr:DUF5679 domain-containing protein [Dictyobacter alpinus]GCE25764.1 hypothetical protein KDA_12480 [Dictyobacter alpinus]